MSNQFFIDKESEIRFFLMLATALALLLFTSYLLGARVERGDVSTPSRTASIFPNVELKAKAAYVYDARTKTVFYAKRESERLSLASLTKLMAAVVASDISPNNTQIIISQKAIETVGDSGLLSNEHWALRDLLDFSLLSSSNDGIRAVALSLGTLSNFNASEDQIIDDFVRNMNKKALKLELKNTYFWNETGLDQSEMKGGGYGTAKDVASLMEYILRRNPHLLEATREGEVVLTSIDNQQHIAKNTNQFIAEIPGLLGSKTGFTETAGGNLAFIFDPELGRPIIVTILGSTASGRFEDARKLIAATLEYIHDNE